MYKGTLKNAGRLLPSALCFALCPLLAAQQAVSVEAQASGVTPAKTFYAYRSSIDLLAELGFDRAQAGPSGSQYGLSIVPFGVPIKLTPVDWEAWDNATVGSTLTFRALNNVVVKGGLFNRKSTYADVYAGDLIEAKVIRVRQSKIRTRKGRAELRVKEVIVGKYIKLELESSPRHHARSRGVAKNLVVWSVKGPYTVTVVPVEYALLLIACSMGCDL